MSKSCTPSDTGTPLGQMVSGQPQQAAHIPSVERFTFPSVAWLLISSVAKKPIQLVLTGRNALSFSMPTTSYTYLGTIDSSSTYPEPSSLILFAGVTQ